MPLSTGQLRIAWSPACKSNVHRMKDAYKALDTMLKAYQYELFQDQCGAANCRTITGGSGYSLHSYFGEGKFKFYNGVSVSMAVAVDLNWRLNPYGPVLHTNMPPAMVTAIKSIRTNNGKQVWGWGGNYSVNKDAMHYEIVCSPDDLATGIRGAVTAPASTITAVSPQEEEEMSLPIPIETPDGKAIVLWLPEEQRLDTVQGVHDFNLRARAKAISANGTKATQEEWDELLKASYVHGGWVPADFKRP